MPRKKLPPGQVKETVGVKLTPAQRQTLEAIGARDGRKIGTVGRDLLLLGLDVFNALEAKQDEIERLHKAWSEAAEETRKDTMVIVQALLFRQRQTQTHTDHSQAKAQRSDKRPDQIVLPPGDSAEPRPEDYRNAKQLAVLVRTGTGNEIPQQTPRKKEGRK